MAPWICCSSGSMSLSTLQTCSHISSSASFFSSSYFSSCFNFSAAFCRSRTPYPPTPPTEVMAPPARAARTTLLPLLILFGATGFSFFLSSSFSSSSFSVGGSGASRSSASALGVSPSLLSLTSGVSNRAVSSRTGSS